MTVAARLAWVAVVANLAVLSLSAARWRDRRHARAQRERLGRDA